MKTKTFQNGLVVKHRRSAIFFENEEGISKTYKFDFVFPTKEAFVAFIAHMYQAANEAWTDVKPKEAFSMASDYDEYYDKKYENNGYLNITGAGIHVEAPHLSKDTLFQFNKAKIQSFLYDLEKKRKMI